MPGVDSLECAASLFRPSPGLYKKMTKDRFSMRRAEDTASPPLSSPDAVIEAICKGIGSGRYVPGQRLVEADLTRELGVSRGPVREALKRLAAERIITLTRHKGAYIRSLGREEVRDLLQNIEVLLGLAARLAAQRIDQADHRGASRRFSTNCSIIAGAG
ncbi:GntR family transcriptional regulator [Alcanivorax sp. IO_7]|nr:GntR family transcriptional regulator [Alcanivorax sp. IO_7]